MTTITPHTVAARMTHPAFVAPGALEALQEVGKAVQRTRVPIKTLELMSLRAGQINGCGVCVTQHPKIAKRNGETDDRIHAVAGWREAPFYTEAERAALKLTEAVTRMADTADPVPDELWEEVARHYDETELAGLIMHVALTNMWNRMNVATRQVAGQEW